MLTEKQREIFEIEKPNDNEIVWYGEPNKLCYVIQSSKIWIIFSIIFFIFIISTGREAFWFIAPLLILASCFDSYKSVRMLKYYITKDYIIVQIKNRFWASSIEGIREEAREGEKVYNQIGKIERYFYTKRVLIKPTFTQSFTEKLFNVKSFKFKQKLKEHGDDGGKIDLYYLKGEFFCIKDYKKVQDIIQI